MSIVGASPSFVEEDDAATISVKRDHPATQLLLDAVKHLGRDQPRAAVECMIDAMTAISVHDDLMIEF